MRNQTGGINPDCRAKPLLACQVCGKVCEKQPPRALNAYDERAGKDYWPLCNICYDIRSNISPIAASCSSRVDLRPRFRVHAATYTPYGYSVNPQPGWSARREYESAEAALYFTAALFGALSSTLSVKPTTGYLSVPMKS